MKPEHGGSDLSGFPEVGGPFVAVARNPVLEWRSWGQTVSRLMQCSKQLS